jgi:hypothetical protein
MLKEALLLIEFWDEAVEAHAYLLNRVKLSSKVIGEDRCPEEIFEGVKPSIDHIRTWGSKCYSYVNPKSLPTHGRQDKLMDRGRVAVFIGYSEETDK